MTEPKLIHAAFAMIVAALLYGMIYDGWFSDVMSVALFLVALILIVYGAVLGVVWLKYHLSTIEWRYQLQILHEVGKLDTAQLAYIGGNMNLVLTPLDEQERFYMEFGEDRIPESWIEDFLDSCKVQYAKTKELPSVRNYPNDSVDQQRAVLFIDMLAIKGMAKKRTGRRALWLNETPHTLADMYGMGWDSERSTR